MAQTTVDNTQASLALKHFIVTQGIFPYREAPGGDATTDNTATIRITAATYTPGPETSGQVLPISQNTALFALLGTTYGGNGNTTFALPNLQGDVMIGAGQGPGLTNFELGQAAGSNTVLLTRGQTPSNIGGSNQPFDNHQASEATNYLIAVEGRADRKYEGALLGQVVQVANNFETPGFLFANGRVLNIADYPALFQLIGTTYGGDGDTTFALPDLRGRAVQGAVNPTGVGAVSGDETVTLSNSNLPFAAGGGSQGFATTQPVVTLNYLIATQGIFPVGDRGGTSADNPFIGEVVAYAGSIAANGSNVPAGFVVANGQLLSIAQNQALFSLVGTTYGGNGTTNFAVPDLRGRVVIDDGTGADGTTVALGQKNTATTGTVDASDIPAPASPIVNTPANGALTNDDTPTFSGTGQKGSTVQILVDGNPIGTAKVDATGSWSFTPTTALSNAAHTVKAVAYFDSSNASANSNTNAVTIDSVALAPVVTSPAAGSTTDDTTPTITGTAEAGATVTVIVDGATKGTAVANGSGNWTFTVDQALTYAPHKVQAFQTDLAGNRSVNSAESAVTIAPPNSAPSFAVGDGKVTTDLGGSDAGYSVAVQSDGKILVAGYSGSDFAVVRYTAAGALDTTFNGTGKVVTDLGGSDYSYSVAIQSDGKILVSGESGANSAVVRYTAAGALDTTFNGTGKVVTDLGGNDAGYSVAVQSDGKILVIGNSNGDFAVVRYTTAGALDTTFNGTGKVVTDLGGNDAGYSVAIQNDGKIVVSGDSSANFAVARYTAAGGLDTTFNGTGKVVTDLGSGDLGRSVAVQSDGKIVVGGYSGNNFAVVRYTAAGALDTTFNGTGKVTTEFSGNAFGYSVAVQSDGKIVVGGYSGNNFAVVRYTAAGALDTTFNGTGKVTTELSGYDYGYSVALQSDGKIVVGGNSNGDFGLVRYNADGTLDKGFDPVDTLGGTVSSTEDGAAVVLDSDVAIYDAELSAGGSYAGATLTLARSGGADAQDLFGASGTLAALATGGALTVGSTTIGTVTKNAGGELTLAFDANATEPLVNTALRLIAYRNGSDTPPAAVTIGWSFSDGNTGGAQGSGGAKSAAGTTVVNITATDDAPVVLTKATGALAYTENDGAAAIAPALTLTDADSTNLTGAKVSISANFRAGDLLDFVNQNGISGSYDSATGVLTLTGTASVENYQAALRSVGYSSTSEDPGSATRTVSFTATSGGSATSATVTRDVAVTAVNDPATFGGKSTGSVTEAGSGNNGGTPTATGTLTASDVDNTPNTFQAVTTPTSSEGGFGSFTISASGTWTYTLNNADSRVQALNDLSGRLADRFTVRSADGTEKMVAVEITGANDAAVIGGQKSGNATESGAGNPGTPTATGTLTAADVDNTPNSFQEVATATATTGGYGKYTISASGAWNYALDNTNAAVQALNVGGQLTDTFTVRSIDGTTQVVTVMINGANDAAAIAGDLSKVLTETDAPLSTTGKLTVTDVDSAATFQAGVLTSATSGATLVLSADGSYTYAASSAHDDLSASALFTDIFSVRATDGTTSTVSITIGGTNDRAVIGGDLSKALNETDAALTATGLLTVSDVDGAASFQPGTLTGSQGGKLTLQTGGSYSYLAASPYNELAAGAKLVETFAVLSADGTPATVSITITGTNDAATITGTASGAVTEDGMAVAGDKLSVSDVDTGEAVFRTPASLAGIYGDFAFDAATGTWGYTLDNTRAAVQALKGGETVTDMLEVKSADGTATQAITVTVTGANDAAMIGAPTVAAVTEDAGVENGNLVARGTISVSDKDAGEATLRTALVSDKGNLGTLTLGSDGAYVYSVANSAAQFLAGSQANGGTASHVDTFTVSSADGTEKVVSFTVNGVNDAAAFSGTFAGALTEDAQVTAAGGAVFVSDADRGESFFQNPSAADLAGSYGAFTFESKSGTWGYTLDGAKAQALGAGEKAVETLVLKSADGGEAPVSVTITGVNDAAVFSGSFAGALTEDSEIVRASGQVSVSDADRGEAAFRRPSPADLAGSYGTFTFDVKSGDWGYTLDGAKAQALGAGEKAVETLVLKSADGGEAPVSVTITGVNDAANVSGDTTGTVREAGLATAGTPTATGDLAASDVDNAADSFQAVTTATASISGHGTYTVSAAGVWSYALDNASAAVQALNAGDTLADSFTVLTADGTAQSVRVTIQGTNDAAAITGQATGTVVEAGAGNNGGTPTATGDLLATDVDNAADAFQAVTAATASAQGYGTYTVSAAGVWSYTLDNANAAVNGLATGQSLTDTFTVLSQDGTAKLVTLTINGVGDNTAPTDIALSNASVAENAAGAVVGVLSGTDADAGDALTFAVNDAASPFEVRVSGGQTVLALKGGVALDFEAGATRAVTVTATDKAGATYSETLTISVGNVNETPFGLALSNASVGENAAGAVVGTLSATDPDGNALTYTVSDSRFRMDTSNGAAVLRLQNGVALDYESVASLTLTVTASDGALSTARDFTIAVQDVNEAPAGQGVQNSDAIEQGATEAPLGLDPLTDPEGQVLTYTVGALPGQGLVTLDGAALAVGQVLSAAQLADLDYTAPDNASGGTIGFTASDGATSTPLTVNLAITPAVAKTYTGTEGADRLDGAALADTLKGLGGNDLLIGGSGDDILSGGDGVDTMRGGAGDDNYYVDNAADVVIETAGAGADRVRASVSYKLAEGQHVETLSTADATATTAINLVGNEFAQTVIGNEGANTLSGGSGGDDTLQGLGGNDALYGGTGNDTLTGGLGSDGFVFNTALNAVTNVDVITDFNSGQGDRIVLESAVFAGLAPGNLAAAALKEIASYAQTAGVDANDRILYDKVHGDLYFDQDGIGTAYKRVKFAEVADGTSLVNTDFLIV